MAPAKLDGDGSLPCHARTRGLQILRKNRFVHCFQQPVTRLSMKPRRAIRNKTSYLILFRRIQSSCCLRLRVSSFLSLWRPYDPSREGFPSRRLGRGDGICTGRFAFGKVWSLCEERIRLVA